MAFPPQMHNLNYEETSGKTKLRDFLQITGLFSSVNGKITKVNMTAEWIQIKETKGSWELNAMFYAMGFSFAIEDIHWNNLRNLTKVYRL